MTYSYPLEYPSCHVKSSNDVICDYSEGATCRMETDSGPGVCMAIYKSCQQYQAMVAGYSGYEINKHIIGGENAKSGEFPFMVSLGYQNDENDRSIISYMCGGSLITDRHVLTAAHCILNTNNYRLIEIRLGSISLQDNSRDVQRISIDDIITHPRYRISRNYFDIAIITMRRPIILSNLTMPICLQTYSIPAFKSYLNSEMIATGWGVTNYNDDSPSLNLKKTRKLSLIDSQTCGEQYRASNRIPNGVDDSLLCILDENPVDRSDVCQGDSGGPLFLKSTVVSSLLGIVSFGQGCASSVPGIYTSVYYYLDWIERIVWPAQ
ncbi:serine protease persephone-like [Phymastichus coffea]|uniref:serine protease persephone-like n=1 Tax=Phymastichus coffea TaxID=108790 RepID=UPI00273A7CF5|nr:serine protease persephone-like [Phymastichus coffea]